MIQDEEEREVALGAFVDEIRNRLQMPRDAFVDGDGAFSRARGWPQMCGDLSDPFPPFGDR